eukprot:scaffold74554_cov35-Prasinocladus_malaysianus.AAC.2
MSSPPPWRGPRRISTGGPDQVVSSRKATSARYLIIKTCGIAFMMLWIFLPLLKASALVPIKGAKNACMHVNFGRFTFQCGIVSNVLTPGECECRCMSMSYYRRYEYESLTHWAARHQRDRSTASGPLRLGMDPDLRDRRALPLYPAELVGSGIVGKTKEQILFHHRM